MERWEGMYFFNLCLFLPILALSCLLYPLSFLPFFRFFLSPIFSHFAFRIALIFNIVSSPPPPSPTSHTHTSHATPLSLSRCVQVTLIGRALPITLVARKYVYVHV
uniref:Uncharacterized protein n=1 Tax=Palpitomonas bilix TaxID=652834 RepID=A0A7S3D327_9EUKA